MPITIDRKAARGLSSHFDHALELVRNEFSGLDRPSQYRNAFSRLLKPDPLRRVLMMGTDQRDLFVPLLRTAIADSVPPRGQVLDFGAGDGQTFALVADAMPAGTTVSFEEPNAKYASDYRAMLDQMPHLKSGMALLADFDDLDEAAQRTGVTLPADGSVHLTLALQMIFFLSDLPAGLVRMARFLRPGGALFIVVADEAVGYTGLALRDFIEGGGETGDNERQLGAIAERHRLLAAPQEGGSELLTVLREALPHDQFTLQTVRQPSRLYGHCLADLLALANIAGLAEVTDLSKFDAPLRLLRDAPESVNLRIEDEGPRQGMWSVFQPQFVTVLRRDGAS